MSLQALKTQLQSCHAINTEPFFSEELKKQIETYNQRPDKIRAEVAKLSESMNTLMQSATSGTAEKPEKLFSDLEKGRGKVMSLKVSLLGVLADKGLLDTPIKAAFTTEGNKMRGLAAERKAELRKTLEATGMIERVIHGSLLADPERRGYADEASRCSTGANARVVTNEELKVMDEISVEMHRRFQI